MNPGNRPIGAIRIESVRPVHRDRVERILKRRWGQAVIVSRGRIHDAATYPGFLAVSGGRIVGLITYRIARGRCEVISLDALRQGKGIGTRLLAAVENEARRSGCREAWLITTNDNLRALRFYQRRGWRLRRIHENALHRSRRLKPEIPQVGMHGIPLRDEIELYRPLVRKGIAR